MEPAVLVCVYYRVAGPDATRAIAAVREIQRTLPGRFGELQSGVLLRCGLPPADPSPDAQPAPAVALSTDATLMETYRLALTDTAGTPAAEASVRDFLASLAVAAAPLAALACGERHVELFVPCAS